MNANTTLQQGKNMFHLKIEINALFWADIVCNQFPGQGIAWKASKFAHECINYCIVLQIKETSIIMLLYWNIYIFFTWGRVLSSSDKQSIALLNTSSTNFFSWPRKGKELHVWLQLKNNFHLSHCRTTASILSGLPNNLYSCYCKWAMLMYLTRVWTQTFWAEVPHTSHCPPSSPSVGHHKCIFIISSYLN